MKLLFLTPQLPYPPMQGTALRNWGLISHLAKRHEVWLLSFDDTATGHIDPELRAACRNSATFPTPKRRTSDRLRTLFTSRIPDMGWRLWDEAFLAQLLAWVQTENFDVVQIEGIELARYGLACKAQNAPCKIVFDDHNCEYQMQQRWFERDLKTPTRWPAAAYSFAQWRRLIGLERAMLQAADATLCVSPQDQAAIQRLDPKARTHVILNGIDVSAYSDWPLAIGNEQDPHPIPGTSNPHSLIFTGKMDFRPNIDAMLWFGDKIWPQIKYSRPDIKLKIVGQKPSPKLDGLRANPNIELTGAVDDIVPHIAAATVYIAPLRIGSGTRFKLLEAMSMRKAIVSTTLGCEGFDVTSGHEMQIADTPSDFAEAVLALLDDEAKRTAMGAAAFRFVSATYDWQAIVPQLENLYRQL